MKCRGPGSLGPVEIALEFLKISVWDPTLRPGLPSTATTPDPVRSSSTRAARGDAGRVVLGAPGGADGGDGRDPRSQPTAGHWLGRLKIGVGGGQGRGNGEYGYVGGWELVGEVLYCEGGS